MYANYLIYNHIILMFIKRDEAMLCQNQWILFYQQKKLYNKFSSLMTLWQGRDNPNGLSIHKFFALCKLS